MIPLDTYRVTLRTGEVPMPKTCPISGRECWDCVEAYREMIHRLASGSNVHRLNNQLMDVVGGCLCKDRDRYFKAIDKFLAILYEGYDGKRNS